MKGFWKYVGGNIIGMIGLSAYILADTFFVANALGKNGLAALNLAISVYSIIHGVGLMLGVGGASRYQVMKAQKRMDEANRFFSHSLLLGLLFGAVCMLLGAVGSEAIARILGADKDIVEMTTVYLRVILLGTPLFVTNNVMIAFTRNDGYPKRAMAAMLIGSGANIVLDYVFMFPLGMGMFGAVLATTLAPAISLGVLCIGESAFRFCKKINWRQTGSLLLPGLSALVTELSSAVVLVVFNTLILEIAGNVGVAAYGIIANIALVVVSVFTGLGQGIQPLASHAYAMNEEMALKQLRRKGVWLACAVACAVVCIAFLCADALVAVFNSEKDTALASIAQNGMHIYFSGFLFAGLNIVSAAFLSATGSEKSGFLLSLIRGLIALVPLAVALSAMYGLNGVWLAFPLAEGVAWAIYAIKNIVTKVK